jgi:DNA-binding LytR/AlgR family response regulator
MELGPDEMLPEVVFITAYDQYALRAFESLAIDYLLKPVKLANLQKSVAKLQSFENTFHKAKQNAAPKDLQDNPLVNYTKRFVLKYGRKWSVVEERAVVMFFAKEKFCYLRSNGKNSVINFTLHELESKLDPAVFVRVHRSSIISSLNIESFKSIGSGRLEITLSDGTKVQSSRSYLQSLKKMLTG